jgi:DNA-binding NarL/FixJ family response regulator
MHIAEAGDGEEAIRHGLSRRFDLIFVDVRLPDGNGLDLARTIKSLFVNAMVCVITSYDMLEYREAAFHNGADHFMVKGDSTEAEIVGLIESWLRAHFVTLSIVSDALYRKQISMLLSVHWPVMIVEEATDVESGLRHAAALNPDLVLLELAVPDVAAVELIRRIRATSPRAALVGMADEPAPTFRERLRETGVEHCVPLTPMGHTQLVAIVDAIHSKQARH